MFNVQIFYSLNNGIASNYREMPNEVDSNRWNEKVNPKQAEEDRGQSEREGERERKQAEIKINQESDSNS